MKITKYFLKSICAAVIAVGEGFVPAPIQDSLNFDILPPSVVQMAPRPVYEGDTLTETYDEWRKKFARYSTLVDSQSVHLHDMPRVAAGPLPVMTLTLDRA